MSEIIEMTIEPTPQWMKDAGKEIAKKYNLRYPEYICVMGIIAKHFCLNRSKQNEESRSDISSISANT